MIITVLKQIAHIKILSVFILLSMMSAALTASAHQILSQEVLDYVAANPDATPEQIQAIAENHDSDTEQIIDSLANSDSFFGTTFDFLGIGFHHLVIGLDHIFFILTIVLLYTSWRKVFTLTLTFTVAHSITLLFASNSLIQTLQPVIEPLIALSIIIMAVLVMIGKHSEKLFRSTIAIVFSFGLFHGLGFAGIVSELSITSDNIVPALLGFNIGIELGQIAVVAVTLPLLLFIKRFSWYRRFTIISVTLLAVSATIWFVERIS